jgi:hypothetical protein
MTAAHACIKAPTLLSDNKLIFNRAKWDRFVPSHRTFQEDTPWAGPRPSITVAGRSNGRSNGHRNCHSSTMPHGSIRIRRPKKLAEARQPPPLNEG